MIRASKSHQHGDNAASTIAISMLYKNRDKGCHAGHKHKSKRGSLPYLGDFLFRRSDSRWDYEPIPQYTMYQPLTIVVIFLVS